MKIHEVFIQLRVKNTPEAIAFYERAFGVKEKYRLVEPSGRVGHAELDFGGTTLMISDEHPELGIRGPQSHGVFTSGIHLHVEDADAMIARAVDAGATVVRPASDAFYGERSGTVRDPFGYEWNLGHEIEKVEPEEMQRRYTVLMNSDKSPY
jgi:uncharacterized glyoxalase superfamily protein PhnB